MALSTNHVKPTYVDGLRSENRDNRNLGTRGLVQGMVSPISRMLNWNYWDDQDPSSRKNSGPTLQRFWWTPDIVCLGRLGPRPRFLRSKKRSTRYFYWMFPNRNVSRSEPPSNPLDATWGFTMNKKTSRSFQIGQFSFPSPFPSFSPPFCVKLIVTFP